VVRKYSIGAVLIVGHLIRRKSRQDFDEKPRVAHLPALQARFCKESRIYRIGVPNIQAQFGAVEFLPAPQ
jgi:hypothetical protein